MGFLRQMLDQANPFDGGKTFNSSQQRPQLPAKGMIRDGEPGGYSIPQEGGRPMPQLQVQQNAGMQPSFPQYEDEYTPDLALNQTYTQGNPQPTRSSYNVQDGRNAELQGNSSQDMLRRLLGL